MCQKRGGSRWGLAPARHLLSLPRGRGPSQTPPSLATDSSISPGPPSPWLPALSPVNKQEPLVVQVPSLAQARGCKGRSPLHKKTKNLPLPAGKGVGGDGGRIKAKGRGGRRQARQATPADSGTARSAGNQPSKPPAGTRFPQEKPVPPGFSPGMQGAKPLA